MLLSIADKLCIIELTIGFETKLVNNDCHKELAYRSLVADLSNDYHSIEFINLSISCLGMFGLSSEYFFTMCTKLGFDNQHLNFTISKLSTIAILTIFFIF